MNEARLGDHAKFLSGFAFKSKHFNDQGVGLPVVRIRDVVRGCSETFYSGEYDDRYIVIAGDYLIGMDGEFNLARWQSEKALLNQRVCKIDSISGDVDRDYLARFLPMALKEIEDATPFVTVKHLSVKTLNDIKIPLPPLDEQKRIVEILDAADALRAKRRETLAELDKLLQATFLDMFGDPVANPKGWHVGTLDDVLSIEHGFAFKSEYFAEDGDYIVLTPGSFFETGGYRDQGKKTKYYTATPPNRYILPKGEILVAMTEQAPGLLGSPIFVPKNNIFLHNQRLGRLRLGDKVVPHFVYQLFNTPWVRGELQRTSTGTKVKHTSPTKIGAVKTIIPPLDLQIQFSHTVESIKHQRVRLQAYLSELDVLFVSLQSRAFNGEL